MSKVFWDSMLFVYLVEDDTELAPKVAEVLGRCFRRGDTLYTSHLSIAETLVGIGPGSGKEAIFLEMMEEADFRYVDFGEQCVQPFRGLRRDFGLKQPDAMNLACAASIHTDIFLTNDNQLLKKHLHVPGIHFISDFTKAPL